jgi:hypothetical protein
MSVDFINLYVHGEALYINEFEGAAISAPGQGDRLALP